MWRWSTGPRFRSSTQQGRPANRESQDHQRVGRAGGQGRPPPLHGQGNPRTARSGRPHARALSRSRGSRALRCTRHGLRRSAGERNAAHHLGLRHGLLCRPRRQILVREAGAAAGRSRRRLGTALSRSGLSRRTARRCSSRNRAKPPTRWRRCATPRRRARRPSPSSMLPESSIAREADIVLPTFAGPEIGVASTKAFTCQLAALAALAIAAGARARSPERARRRKLCAALLETPRHIVGISEAGSRRSKCWARKSPRRATCSIWAAA